MSGRFSFIALVALSRKKALIVEPIWHTWRNNSSYSSGRSFTVTRTVQADLRSVSVICCCFFRYLPELSTSGSCRSVADGKILCLIRSRSGLQCRTCPSKMRINLVAGFFDGGIL
jgi:hypothetical protein